VGIGFAIPINLAKWIKDELVNSKDGRVKRGYIGVRTFPVNEELLTAKELRNLNNLEELLNHLGLKEPKGAVVVEVVEDTPADKAGIKLLDVITSFNGEEIRNPTDLSFKAAKAKPGQQATVDLMRKGKKMTLTVTVEERPRRQPKD
jgi:serine protease Do